jgi:mevalonate kinase
MKHLYEYESWSDYKTPYELRSRIELDKKQRAKDFFKKRIKGEEASDMFIDDEEFKQDMLSNFIENGCHTKQQLDFLLSLDPPKGNLTQILNVNHSLLKDLGELISSYPGSVKKMGRSAEEFESYIDSITMVNKALNNLIHG